MFLFRQIAAHCQEFFGTLLFKFFSAQRQQFFKIAQQRVADTADGGLRVAVSAADRLSDNFVNDAEMFQILAPSDAKPR